MNTNQCIFVFQVWKPKLLALWCMFGRMDIISTSGLQTTSFLRLQIDKIPFYKTMKTFQLIIEEELDSKWFTKCIMNSWPETKLQPNLSCHFGHISHIRCWIKLNCGYVVLKRQIYNFSNWSISRKSHLDGQTRVRIRCLDFFMLLNLAAYFDHNLGYKNAFSVILVAMER